MDLDLGIQHQQRLPNSFAWVTDAGADLSIPRWGRQARRRQGGRGAAGRWLGDVRRLVSASRVGYWPIRCVTRRIAPSTFDPESRDARSASFSRLPELGSSG